MPVKTKIEKLKRLPHIISGVVILMHCLERFETGHSTAYLFLVAGIVFLGIAFFHHRIAQKLPWIDTVFYIIEAVLAFVIAYEYHEAGKTALPFIYVFAGLLQVGVTILFATKKTKIRH